MTRTVPEIAALVSEGLSALDGASFADVLAADVVFETPFSGLRIEGRDAVLRAFAAGQARARAAGLTKARVTTTLTDSGFVVELVVSGPGFEIPSSVGILTVSDGEITSYRDYPNLAADTEAAVKSAAREYAE